MGGAGTTPVDARVIFATLGSVWVVFFRVSAFSSSSGGRFAVDQRQPRIFYYCYFYFVANDSRLARLERGLVAGRVTFFYSVVYVYGYDRFFKWTFTTFMSAVYRGVRLYWGLDFVDANCEYSGDLFHACTIYWVDDVVFSYQGGLLVCRFSRYIHFGCGDLTMIVGDGFAS